MRNNKTTGLLMLLIGFSATGLVFLPAQVVGGEVDAEKAQELFVETHRCVRCHSVASADLERESEKMKGPDIGGYTTEDVEALIRFLRKEEERADGTKHKKTYDGSDEELMTILCWLETLEPAPEE